MLPQAHIKSQRLLSGHAWVRLILCLGLLLQDVICCCCRRDLLGFLRAPISTLTCLAVLNFVALVGWMSAKRRCRHNSPWANIPPGELPQRFHEVFAEFARISRPDFLKLKLLLFSFFETVTGSLAAIILTVRWDCIAEECVLEIIKLEFC